MKNFPIYFLLVLLVKLASSKVINFNLNNATSSANAGISPLLTGSEYLDSEKKYLLHWNINQDEETIYFEVTAETKGYVGFGISPNGGMTGADILIAGVHPSGTAYSFDCHGEGNYEPVVDAEKNWVLTYGEETETHTKLSFHRKLNTCDKEHDLTITDGTMRIIWAMGDTDVIEYHGGSKGTKSLNFYLKDETDFDPEPYNNLDLLVTMKMPVQHTAYWCTIHRAPVFTEKQHIVAIEPILNNPDALEHTHHFIFFRCLVPDDQDASQIFEPWVGHPGDFCHDQADPTFPFEQYCNGNMVYVWSKGGKRLVFPPNLGLPMPEKPGFREYWALEIHYDNPESADKPAFQTGGRMYYTSDLRDEEVAILVVSQEVEVQLTVPPQSTDFVISGHCSSECTQKFLPEEGVTIFNNLFHAHLAGRKLKLRQFRGEEELSWVDVDEYYDFDFQQSKQLTNFRKVERGDQLTVECTYDSTKAAGAVVGGLSTKEEMCQAIVYYYPRQDFFFCSSRQNLEDHMNLLGITKYEEKDSDYAGGIPTFNILEPVNLAGDYQDSVSFKVDWTQELRERYQREKLYGEQIGVCNGGVEFHDGPVKYPENVNVYVPPDTCDRENPDFEEWVKENLGVVQDQLAKLQESVDLLATDGDKSSGISITASLFSAMIVAFTTLIVSTF